MKMEDATGFTSRCINGEPASCSYACYFHLDIRSFLEKVSNGRFQSAYKELRNAVVFPEIVSTLCDAPCRKRCQRSLTGDEAIDLIKIESAVIKNTKNRKPDSYFIPQKTQSIAVVGAGVSGLSCALNLAHKKYNVTVFEKNDAWGGRLSSHPRFKEFEEDITLQYSAVNTDFKFGNEIKSLDELKDFDAVYIATGSATTGSGGNSFGLIDSWDAELLTTSNPNVFMGGELCGVSLMQGIAHGVSLSKIIEVYLLTGKAADIKGSCDWKSGGRYLDHTGTASSPIVTASGKDGYTEGEARQEAGRCMRCNCEKCMIACEMLKSFKKIPHRMGVEVFTDSGGAAFSSCTLTRETYSCNICGYCESICPVSVDIGDLLQFSRADRRKAGKHPASLQEFWLNEMDFFNSEGFFASAPKGEETARYVFFPGCKLGPSKPEYVIKTYEHLQKKYNAGIVLGCCGAPAYWAGDEARLKENAEKLKDIWAGMGKPVMILACASCGKMFRLLLPEIKFISLYELLSDETDIAPAKIYSEASVFDPCAARDDSSMQAGVRKLAEKAGVMIEELKESNRCCGYGGHMRIANPSLYEEIAANRIKESDKPYIVYCANCREVFISKNKQCIHVLDMIFNLNEENKIPSLQQKRINSLEVKKLLMKKYRDMDFQPEVHEWDMIKLTISDEMQEYMEKKLITEDNLKEAIWLAEKSGDKFIDENGMSLCSMEKPLVTYWVEYKTVSQGVHEISNAYYHRMHFHKDR